MRFVRRSGKLRSRNLHRDAGLLPKNVSAGISVRRVRAHSLHSLRLDFAPQLLAQGKETAGGRGVSAPPAHGNTERQFLLMRVHVY